MEWEFKREEAVVNTIADGRYRCRIENVEKSVSSNGNNMLKLSIRVSGFAPIINYYIVFMESNPEFTNRILTQLYDSFYDIKAGDLNTLNWIGKMGACQIKHEDYNGHSYAKIAYFIRTDDTNDIPNWVEPPKPQSDIGYMQPPEADELPFF